jgi:serine/threonine-protein kinase
VGDLLASGEVVAERYRVAHLLGEGGMGAVYLAEHVHMHKRFALKVLHPDFVASPEILARFEREAVAAGHVEHPNVAAATDFGQLADGSFFLVLEYVAGRSLRDEIDKGPLPLERALHVLRGISAGLGAAHAAGIVHRDLKPENVMLVQHEGDPDFVKILDFGIAKLDPGAPPVRAGATPQLTRAGAVLGTPDYMAPEQALGEAVDARADLYALGIILYEMLTGNRPFHGGALTVMRDRIVGDVPELPADVAAHVEAPLRDVLRRLLMPVASARFQTVTELSTAIAVATAPAVPALPARTTVTNGRGGAVDPLRATVHAMSAVVMPRLAVVLPRLERLAGSRRRLLGAGALVLVALVVVLVSRCVSSPPKPIYAPAVRSVAPPQVDTASDPEEENPPPPELPPPPSPEETRGGASARPHTTAAPPASGRRTGPGGVYIPPPSQWFK